MSKIAELDDYKLGKQLGATRDPKHDLKSDNNNYRKGFYVGRKHKSKETLENAFSDSALYTNLKSAIAQYRKTKDSATYNRVLDLYQEYSNRHISDADDEEFVLMESENGEPVLTKKYKKENLANAKQYLDENTDTEIVGKDDEGSVYIAEKDDDAKKEDEKKVIGDSNKNNNKMSENYKLTRISDSQFTVSKDGDATYRLIKVKDHWGCTCQGYYFRGACKHLDMLKGKVADSELVARVENHTRRECELVADSLKRVLDGHKWAVSGEYRRGCETVTSLPIVVECSDSEFKTIENGIDGARFAKMVADSSIIRGYYDNVPVVLIRAADGQMATHLLSTTGTKEENMRLRDCAKKKGYRLVENGLFDSAGNLVNTPDEQTIYRVLGERYKQPNER